MTRREQHVKTAQTNRDRAARYQDAFESDPDWALVLRFYAALHLVDAYLDLKGQHVENHVDRHKLIRHYPELSQGRGRLFRENYKKLQNQSEQVRYDPGYILSANDLSASEEALSIVFRFLESKVS